MSADFAGHHQSQGEQPGRPSGAELETLLRRGAYALMEESADAERSARAFCEADIEQILEERSTVRVVEGGKTPQWLNKSSFSVDPDRANLDVDDPRFWEKAMPSMRAKCVSFYSLLQKAADLPNDTLALCVYAHTGRRLRFHLFSLSLSLSRCGHDKI